MARVPLNRTITQNISSLHQPNEQLLGKNLGENGTGIRKISTTQVPLTTVTVPSVKAPSEGGRNRLEIPLHTSDYEESVELPDVDVGDDNLNQTLRQHNISVVKNVRVCSISVFNLIKNDIL